MKNRRLLAISVLLLVVWFLMVKPNGETRVIFCNVDQGDGAVVIKNNFQMVIDAGPGNGKMASCLGKYVPFWDKKIEVFVASHGDKDHVGGLEMIKKSYRIEKELTFENFSYGDIILADGIEFRVLGSNELSLIGVLKYDNKSFLFMGDAAINEELMVNQEVDVLKVGHHGSATSTGESLLDRIKAKVAVISVGKNSYGHPSEIVMDRLKNRGIEIKRTDLEGDIIF